MSGNPAILSGYFSLDKLVGLLYWQIFPNVVIESGSLLTVWSHVFAWVTHFSSGASCINYDYCTATGKVVWPIHENVMPNSNEERLKANCCSCK